MSRTKEKLQQLLRILAEIDSDTPDGTPLHPDGKTGGFGDHLPPHEPDCDHRESPQSADSTAIPQLSPRQLPSPERSAIAGPVTGPVTGPLLFDRRRRPRCHRLPCGHG